MRPRPQTVLALGQIMVLSTPHETGALLGAVEINRQAGTVLARRAATAATD